MPDLIQLLPDSIANQIAAGEVVQRPASVVKELLENSIDAGATEIKLIVKDAGKQLIQVIDNGKGMSETDARMCFERHATSKLRTTEDLFNIRTLGFRGEAMASIAAVAQVELKTKRPEDELGILVNIEGSKVTTQEPAAVVDGTSISVKNLFFNVPARRNFLKSNPVELRHIIDEFQRVALAHPEIHFKMIQNDLETYHLPPSKLSQRIVNLFGKSYQQQLITVEESTEVVKIHGYIGKPDCAKRTRGEQFFFANNRFIKHPYLNHAVTDAFEGMLQDKTYPFYVLFMEMDPKTIDINVHPTKTEIKFEDERTIYAILKSAVKMGLGTHNVTPSIDFDLDINFGVSTVGKRDYGNTPPPFEVKKPASTTTYNPPKPGPLESNNKENWERLYDSFETRESKINRDIPEEPLKFVSEDAEPDQEEVSLQKSSNNTFQIQNRFIVSQVKSGMLLIDQQAAHERVLYEKYLSIKENNSGASQQFLFPQQVELSAADFALVKDIEEEIKALGFVFSDFGQNTLVIDGVPADIPNGTEKDLFEGLIEQFKINKGELKADNKENLARSLAKRASIKAGKRLNPEEMHQLIDQLFACSNPNFAPYGNRTYVILDLNTISQYFK
jgi:DNA mismatch repair protein MutL